MSNAMPSALIQAMLASQTNKQVLDFLTITYGSNYLYLVNNLQAITRGGNVYQPFSFAIELPTSKDGEIGKARLTIDAVDQQLINALRNATSRIQVMIVVALADTPDATPELNLGTFELTNITYNKLTVNGDLSYHDALDFLVPSDIMSSNNVPGIF